MSRRAGRWIVGALLRVILAASVVAVVGFLLCLPLHGTKRSTIARLEDTSALRCLVGLVASSGKLPMKDGAFDVYAFVRSGEILPEQIKLLRSERSEIGPTIAEIERGDYANFPWERYRGDGRIEGPPFPLLWEGKPDEDGKVLVALSDGTVVHREPR